MAAAFCMQCGQPLPPGAAFCARCGTAVPNVAGAAPGGPAAPAPAPPTAPNVGPPNPTGPPLAEQLGLATSRRFLLQHLLIGAKFSYRVMDGEKRLLCSFGENVSAEREAALTSFFHAPRPFPETAGFVSVRRVEPFGRAERTAYWVIDDRAGQLRGTIALEYRGREGQATVSDAAGTPGIVLRTTHSGLTGLAATASAPDGRPLFEARGSLMSHNFSIHDARGNEVAKVHEAWASVRDTFAVDLVGNADPLGVLLLSVVIDHFKVGEHRDTPP